MKKIMTNVMESITYVVTALAAIGILHSSKIYWEGMGIYLYISFIMVSITLLAVYISILSKKDSEWWIKLLYISGISIIVSTIISTEPYIVAFTSMISTVAGFSTYYNYYRMVDYIHNKKLRNNKIMYTPEKLPWERSQIMEIDKYLYINEENLITSLKNLKKGIVDGDIMLLRGEDGKTLIKVVRK